MKITPITHNKTLGFRIDDYIIVFPDDGTDIFVENENGEHSVLLSAYKVDNDNPNVINPKLLLKQSEITEEIELKVAKFLNHLIEEEQKKEENA